MKTTISTTNTTQFLCLLVLFSVTGFYSVEAVSDVLKQVYNDNTNYDTLIDTINQQTALFSDDTQGDNTITIFGPNDDAMARDLSKLTSTSYTIKEVLENHIVSGTYTANDILTTGCMELTTLGGGTLKINTLDHGSKKMIMVNDVHVIIGQSNIQGSDGSVFHGVDGIILPTADDTKRAECPSSATSITVMVTAAATTLVVVALVLA